MGRSVPFLAKIENNERNEGLCKIIDLIEKFHALAF